MSGDNPSVAVVYDARRSRPAAGSVLGAADLRVHILPAGSTFDPVSGRVSVATGAGH